MVVLIGYISNSLVRLLGINPEKEADQELGSEELRAILLSSGMPKRQQDMLMGIFDMDYLSVNDVMIPKNEIVGIDLKDDIQTIVKNLNKVRYTHIPLYKDTIDNISGFLSSNRKADFLSLEKPSKTLLKTLVENPLFIPENTPLSIQPVSYTHLTLPTILLV